ncbi:hypothetical protein [Castellaniella sp. MT123]|uniref:hypothetical protein n=1 Tax=Castellaniella sp. MT123 TaxID=3140381 RepID=UPI0031F41B09|nr:hypothetical protein [Castellaniella sp.]
MNHVYTPNLMSDALERAYAYTILNESQPLGLTKGLRAAGRALRRGAKAVGRGVANMINAQAEARARNMLYNRTHW